MVHLFGSGCGMARDLTEAEDVKQKWQEYTEELYGNIFMIQKTTMV